MGFYHDYGVFWLVEATGLEPVVKPFIIGFISVCVAFYVAYYFEISFSKCEFNILSTSIFFSSMRC